MRRLDLLNVGLSEKQDLRLRQLDSVGLVDGQQLFHGLLMGTEALLGLLLFDLVNQVV